MKINVYRNTSQFYILYKHQIYIKISDLSFDTTIHLRWKKERCQYDFVYFSIPNEIIICKLSPFDSHIISFNFNKLRFTIFWLVYRYIQLLILCRNTYIPLHVFLTYIDINCFYFHKFKSVIKDFQIQRTKVEQFDKNTTPNWSSNALFKWVIEKIHICAFD